MSHYNNMRWDDASEFITEWLKFEYPLGAKWEIAISTKRNSKAKIGDADYYSKYTLYVHSDGETFESDEQKGTNKNHWCAKEIVKFLRTLSSRK